MHKLLAAALLLLLAPIPSALAQRRHDQVNFGKNITVAEGETASDIACVFCTVRIHGDVHGDVAVSFGSILIDTGHTVSGDVALLGGDLSMADDASINGDLAILGGDTHISPDAHIHGSRSILQGHGWLLLPLIPLLLLAGILWLIVHFIRQYRYRRSYTGRSI